VVPHAYAFFPATLKRNFCAEVIDIRVSLRR